MWFVYRKVKRHSCYEHDNFFLKIDFAKARGAGVGLSRIARESLLYFDHISFDHSRALS